MKQNLVEKLIKYIKSFFKNNKLNILDIGTGSGAISISLKKEISSEIDSIDISDDAISLANENAILNNVNLNIYKSDIFSDVNKKYDVIVSNPPYISYEEKIMDKVFNYEPHLALFAEDNGLYFYKRIIDDCKKYLNNKFIIAFEIGELQGKSISEYAKRILCDSNVIVEKDLSGRDRFVFIFSE